jgi:succinate-semialdehyde dehydrogenase/glutarate-semialdehyde dehydrogenase
MHESLPPSSNSFLTLLFQLTLELGGNCPFVVFDDADVGKAVDALMQLKWHHTGQACITANRVYVQKGIYDEFQRLFVEKTKQLKIGHGAVDGTTLGPLTTPGGVDKVEAHVQDAISHGGRIALGGTRPSHGSGFFYPATVISEANDKMLVAAEETFGPLCALFRFDTEDEAVGCANNTSLGLASYVFTRDVNRIWRLLESLEAGMVGLNTGTFFMAEYFWNDTTN